MTRKKIFNYVARSAMTLFLAVAGITNASAAVDFLGHSAINVNGTWYYTDDENHSWCTGGNFNGANLGTFANTLRLSGQSQTWESGNVNWNSGTVTMYYKFDDGAAQSIGLDYYQFANNNNYFQSGGSNFALQNIDISKLTPGNHTISVWFNCGDKWDSNNGNNYVATFTISSGPVSYLDANGNTLQETATLLTGSEYTSEENPLTGGWYVVNGTVDFNRALYFSGNVNLILADGADVTIDKYDETGISTDGNLNIYAQSLGNSKGSIRISKPSYGIWANNVNINGGNVGISDCIGGIYAYTGDVYLNGGDVTIDCENTGISAKLGSGIITLAGTSVTANSYSGTVKIASGLVYSDGTNNNIKGTISDVSDIANKTLSLYGYSYLDENGDEQTCTNYTLLTNETDISSPLGTSGDETWYVVKGKVSYNNILHFIGDTHLILADDANFTINVDDGCGIKVEESGIESNITIYAQSIGESKGKVAIEAGTGIYVWNGNLTINGGDIIANGYASGIDITYGKIIINDGTITASGTEANGICTSTYDETNCDIIINGGTIITTGDSWGIYGGGDIIINGGNIEYYDYGGINANGGDGTITLNGGTVKASSYYGTVTVGSGFSYTDEENGSYTGVISDNDVLANKILEPSGYTLTANQPTDEDYAGTYWTTLYFRSLGFKINNNVNACAYTATYDSDNSEITLDKLGEDGKSIPQNTAVIIVSSTPSVSMTADGTLGTFTGSNDLHGVDVSTPTADIISDLGSGTFYVMGQTSGAEGGFGFHKYIGTTMPARKAFLLIDGDGAALARMVFNDATGIKSIDNGLRTIDNESDAWYSLDGRMLSQKPTTKGVYINNGKKIVIK